MPQNAGNYFKSLCNHVAFCYVTIRDFLCDVKVSTIINEIIIISLGLIGESAIVAVISTTSRVVNAQNLDNLKSDS